MAIHTVFRGNIFQYFTIPPIEIFLNLKKRQQYLYQKYDIAWDAIFSFVMAMLVEQIAALLSKQQWMPETPSFGEK